MTTSALFGAGECEFTASFYLTDEATYLTFPNVTAFLKPEQTKSSFRFYCPWRGAVARKNGGIAPGPNALLLGRYVSLDLTLSFRYTTGLVEPPFIETPVLFAVSPWTWTTWTEQECATPYAAGRVMSAVPYPESVIFGKSNARMKTETLDWAVDLLTWAAYDNYNVSFANFNAIPVPGVENNFTAQGNLRMEFQDCTEHQVSFCCSYFFLNFFSSLSLSLSIL